MATKRPPSPFVSDPDGVKWVWVELIMHPLIPYMDGIGICTFKGDRRTYLKVSDGIAWLAKEQRETRASERPRLRILQAMLEQYRDCEADSFAFDPAKSGLTQQEVDAAFGITPAKRKRKRLNEKYGRK